MTYLVIKDHNSKLYVYWLPVTNEGTLLPDVHWGRYGGYCQNFGPEMNGDFIKKDGVITCHDSKELTEAFMWSYDGKNIGSYSHNKNMPIAKYTIDGEYLVLGKL